MSEHDNGSRHLRSQPYLMYLQISPQCIVGCVCVCVSTAIGYLRYRSRSTLVLQVSILSRPFTLVPINSYGDDIDDATAAAASLGRDGNWVSPKLVEDLRPDLLQGPTMVALDGSGSAVFTNLRLAELASNHRHLV